MSVLLVVAVALVEAEWLIRNNNANQSRKSSRPCAEAPSTYTRVKRSHAACTEMIPKWLGVDANHIKKESVY